MNKIILSKREIKKKQKFIRFLKENDTLAEFIIEFNKGYFIYERQNYIITRQIFHLMRLYIFIDTINLDILKEHLIGQKQKNHNSFGFFLSRKEREI